MHSCVNLWLKFSGQRGKSSGLGRGAKGGLWGRGTPPHQAEVWEGAIGPYPDKS